MSSKKNFYSYLEACEVVKKMGIQTRAEYLVRYKEDPLLPSTPERVYKSSWEGIRTFLGTESCVPYNSYGDAKKAAVLLGIKNRTEYKVRYKEDKRLPACPGKIYKNGWSGYRDFLREIYATYKEASEAAIKLGLKSWNDYRFRYKEDSKLPAKPERRYKSEWVGFPDFLGLGNVERYSSYQECKAAVIKLGIRSWQEYQKRYKEDPFLPASPSMVYRDEFEGFHKFLGKFDMYSYEEAKRVVRSYGIKNKSDYGSIRKLDRRLYVDPSASYGTNWIDYNEFFGTRRKRFYSKYKYAKKAAARLGIKSRSSYKIKYKLDPFLPHNPNLFYSEQWTGFIDFLDLPTITEYETYQEAQNSVKRLGIKSLREYKKKKKLDQRLPTDPSKKYAKDWCGFKSFLGTEKTWYKTYNEASKAVQKLGLTTQKEYSRHYKKDSLLPSMPARFYSDDWVGWGNFLGIKQKEIYLSYDRASKAAQKLNISCWSEYKERYVEDPLLPGCPHVVYKSSWNGIYHFLKKKRPAKQYLTYSEAREAVKRLNIITVTEYKTRYKEDPRLPSHPSEKYHKEWTSMPAFLSKDVKNYYPTYLEASDAIKKLKIINQTDYWERYKKDPRLPSTPNIKYSQDWTTWDDFIYPKVIRSLDDLKHLCKCMGIRDSQDYREKRKKNKLLIAKPDQFFDDWVDWYDLLDIPKPYSYSFLKDLVIKNGCKKIADYHKLRISLKNPKIPSNPESYYSEWTNSFDFFGKERPYQVKYFSSQWELWAEKIEDFLKLARGGDTKAKDLCEFVRRYIEPNGFERCPLEFLSRDSTNIQPMIELFELASITRKKKWLFSINEFLDWVITEYLIIENENTGEITHIKGAKNPFSHINFNGEIAGQVVNETKKLALPYQYVKSGREWIFPSDSMGQKLSYGDLAHLRKFSSDWVQVIDTCLLDRNDPDCVFKVEDGKTYLWLPIHWTYTYALMQLPARGMQIVYCDSGEADEELADFKNNKVIWTKNKSTLAGLTHQQSMVSKSGQGDFGVHYTSNKTKFDGSGYTIPFMPVELAYWLVKLRKWQQKYNPIEEPTKWLDCVRTNLNEVQRRQKGINCFLFRDYLEKEPGTFGGRLSMRLAAALFFSAKNDIETATFRGLKYNESIKELESYEVIPISFFKSPYTPHSMRVSLINAYAYEFGIPLEVIMKLVGHSSIIMSIYYIKSDKIGANLREKMEVGEKEALNKATKTLRSFIEKQRIEEVKSQLVGSSVEQLNLLDNTKPVSSYLWKDYGICPVGGAFCTEGGCSVATKANIHHPVT